MIERSIITQVALVRQVIREDSLLKLDDAEDRDVLARDIIIAIFGDEGLHHFERLVTR